MRVVTNEALIARNKKISQSLFFVSMALLVGGFLFASQIAATEYAAIFQCVMIPLMFLIVIVSVRLTNKWIRPPHPWEAIPASLKGVSNETILYNYVLPVEHVLVTDSGVFAIVTRFQERHQKVTDDNWHLTGGFLTLMRQEQIGDPSKDAKQNAEKAEAFIRETTGDETISVQPLVVFVNPKATVTMEGEQSVPILFAESGKKSTKPTLKAYLRDVQVGNFPVLTEEHIRKIDDALLYEQSTT